MFQILSPITYEPGERDAKKHDFGRFFFHFQIIETFGYLEILETDFSLSLSKCF